MSNGLIQRMKPHDIRRKNLKLLIDKFYEGKTGRFADFMGKKRPTIYRLFSNADSARDIGEDLAREIETLHKLPPHWMDVPHKATEPMADHNVEPAPRPRSRVQIVARVPAGSPGQSVVEVLGQMEFDSPASKEAFALQVKGESMVRPDGTGFPHGCYILVEPRRRAKSGDFVVVRFEDQDEETFKQLVLDGQVLLLKPLNPSYPIHKMGPHAHIAGTVIEKRIVERF